MEGSAKTNNENCKIFRDDSWISQFRNCSNPWMARFVYGMMFLVANLLAWAARDYAHGPLIEMERFNRCHGKGDCRGTEGVLRVSLGCFIFFIIMFLSTVCTSKLHQPRNIWHSGWWCTKIMLLIFLGFFPFVVPSPFIQLYGEVAHFGAGVFLLIQLISIISFITWLNDWCESKKYAEKCHIHVMLLAPIAYLICLVGIILMYIWYVPEPSCPLNIFFITWTLVLLQLMTSISLHPKVNTGFLTPGLMGLYVVFICWCAIRSEPAGGSCNRKAEASNQTDWLTIIVMVYSSKLDKENRNNAYMMPMILTNCHPFNPCTGNSWMPSFIVALHAMVIATFSTGIDSQCFQFRKKDLPDEDDVPYGYGFFHFVFATGAMYFAMLLIGWNTHHPMKKWTIDVGWSSTWVRIVNEWLAVCVYLWMVLAPLVWKSTQVGDIP